MRVEASLRARSARLVTVRMTESVMAAARLLRAENIGALVVKDTCATEGDVVVGVISERDILRAIADHGTGAFSMSVSAVMERTAVFCQPDDTTDRALALMNEHHVRYLPVLQNDALIGVVSMRDVVGLCQSAANAPAPAFASA